MASARATALVLIESDWNLKQVQENRDGKFKEVLIESDWNLKLIN